MKIDASVKICYLNGKPIMVDQVPERDAIGKVLMVGGQPQLTGGVPLTVGLVIANVLTLQKHEKFSYLRSLAVAQTFYKSSPQTDVNEGDVADLIEIVQDDKTAGIYTPLVIGQVVKILQDAKEKVGKAKK